MATSRVLSRVPLKEVGFVAALLVGALAVGVVSGRAAILPEVLRPALWVTTAVGGVLGNAGGYVHRQDQLVRDTRWLHKRVDTLEGEVARLHEANAENARLKALLGLKDAPPGQAVTARVIGRSPDNWHERLILDAGSADGVQAWGLAVAPRGLVGRITTVSPHTSVVQLVSDPAIAVSVLDQRSRSAGVIAGGAEGRMTLRYLLQQVDFRIGDTLVTSGLGGRFPKGMPVGRVTRVMQQAHAVAPDVMVTPSVNLDTLEEVRVYPPGQVVE